MKTGVNATKLAIAAFIVPYIFAYNPALLFENLAGWWQVLQIAATSLVGIFGVAACLNGYLFRKIPLILRLGILIGGLMLLYPSTITDLVGIAIVAAVVLIQYLTAGKKAAAA